MVSFRGVVLQQNRAAEEGEGRGLYVLAEDMTLSESHLLVNAAPSSGGMYCWGRVVAITAACSKAT